MSIMTVGLGMMMDLLVESAVLQLHPSTHHQLLYPKILMRCINVVLPWQLLAGHLLRQPLLQPQLQRLLCLHPRQQYSILLLHLLKTMRRTPSPVCSWVLLLVPLRLPNRSINRSRLHWRTTLLLRLLFLRLRLDLLGLFQPHFKTGPKQPLPSRQNLGL